MRSRIAALALTMSLGFAAPASASTTFTFVNAGSVTAFGYYVGQYNGLEGAPVNAAVILNCVDFFHHIAAGDVWQANLTSLGSSAGIGTVTRFNNLTAYRQAAFLTTQYAGKSNSDIGDIQATIWNLFSGTPTPPSPSTSIWATMAAAYVAANPSGSTYQNFWVVSDVNTHLANGADNPNSRQEFIIDEPFNPNFVPTPEPATLTLLATGLVGIAGFARRRKP